MTANAPIPEFTLFGETEAFPDVVHCEHFSARAPVHGWQISAHRHPQMVQLFLVHSGRIDATTDGTPHCLRRGDLLFIPANTVHRFVFEPDTAGLVISVPLAVLNAIGPGAADLHAALALPFACPAGRQINHLARLIASSASTTGHPFRAQLAVGLAHALLAQTAAQGAQINRPQPGTSARLAALDHLIARHMADGWNSARYAAALAISTGHLSRLCRAATGKGAAAHIEARIIAEACRLLAFTQLPVAEIGYRTGYADPSYFSKRFRAHQQQSPSDYRAQFRTTAFRL